ncbi:MULTISPECIES: TMEM165/GDT1 family protein [Novosphingobium]|uniref:GDT1 family protein n=1 Tax=Novosphingobium decolorationis TaxID=2698673 RepID=A0ABX8ED18_9SPHN|nr:MULTISPECIES: TMEM165/GDT1 family protein [Novosphingobium]MED5544525.1 TMEM165/GDT1 family protein [Pseudomonadota bacterium]QVM86329.1 TMEM165/GDT1 family protein [Novosphingobium decolorationis]
MEAFLTSSAVVALAEVGDKTQLLAIVLATRFKKPWPIVAGIFVATLANHFLAALVGEQAAAFLDGLWFRYLVAASFIVMGLWTLIPDKFDEDDEPKPGRFGPFLATVIAFFLVEMGDKTQIATVALAARFESVIPVMLGTTLGMMIANAPAVFLGNALIERVPMRVVHMIAALLFVAIGLWLLVQTAGWLG